jgi:hypothetical protein
MDISNIEKKLREAQFFLDYMRTQERKAFADRERFDFFLSAFLSASRSVLLRLQEFKGPFARVFLPWRSEVWSRGMAKPDRKAANRLIDFFQDERNLEVHEGGSTRTEHEKSIPVYSQYSDQSGTVQVFSPPALPGSPESPPAQVFVPAYYFTIDGVARNVTSACSDYLKIIQQMVDQFKADHP